MIDLQSKTPLPLCIIGHKEDEDVYIKNTVINAAGKRMSSVDLLNKDFYTYILDVLRQNSNDDKIKNWKAEYVYDYELEDAGANVDINIPVKILFKYMNIFMLSDFMKKSEKVLREEMPYVKVGLIVDKGLQLKVESKNKGELTVDEIAYIEMLFNDILEQDLGLEIFDIYCSKATDNHREFYFSWVFLDSTYDEDYVLEIKQRLMNGNITPMEKNANLIQLMNYRLDVLDIDFLKGLTFSGISLEGIYPGINVGFDIYLNIIENIAMTLHTGVVETHLYKKVYNGIKQKDLGKNITFEAYLLNDGDLVISEVRDKKTDKIVAVKSNYVKFRGDTVEYLADENHDYLLYLYKK